MSYNYNKDCSCRDKKRRHHHHKDNKPTEQVNFAPPTTSKVVQSVRGSGNINDGGGNFRTFAFVASRHEDGSVSGEWQRVVHVDESQTKAHGTITCFKIEGNKARLAGFVKSGQFSTPPNNGVAWRVVDNGQGANDSADQISLQFQGLSPDVLEPYCEGVFGDIPDLIDVLVGNIQITP
jgi:hypothetical protein